MSYTNLIFLKSDGVGNLTPFIPSVQPFFPGVVVHHGVVAVLVCELYVGVPLSSCLGVVSKVDGSGPAGIGVDTVDHSTRHKSIAHIFHPFCAQDSKRKVKHKKNKNKSLHLSVDVFSTAVLIEETVNK